MDDNVFGSYGVLRFMRRHEETVVASYPIDDDVLTFGCDPSCSVRLYYPTVSPLHAKIIFHERKVGLSLVYLFAFRHLIRITASGIHSSFRSTRYFCRQVSSIPRISDVPHDRPPDKQLGDRNKQETVSLRLSAQSTPSCPCIHPTARCIKIRAETCT